METKTERPSLDPAGRVPNRSKTKQNPVVESWEDDVDGELEISSSGSETEKEAVPQLSSKPDAHHGRSQLTGATLPIPNAPPPTPISSRSGGDWSPPQLSLGSGTERDCAPSLLAATASLQSQAQSRSSSSTPSPHSRDGDRRPEKTTATAGRLIAGALGVRAPKKTEEERRYEKAIREKEIRRREREAEERKRLEEEDERAKREIWDG